MPIENLPLWIGFALAVLIVAGLVWRTLKNRSTDRNALNFREKLEQGVGDPLFEAPQEPSFAEPVEEVAARTEPQEEIFADAAEPAPEAKPKQPPQPVQTEIDFSGMGAAAAAPRGRLAADVDSGVEAIVNITPRTAPFEADKLRSVSRILNENNFGEMVRVDYQDAETGRWSHSAQGIRKCSQIYLALLLANRGRVLDPLTASNYINLADRIAIELGADASLPDSQAMLEASRQIADVVAHFDNALAIKIAAPADFDPSAVRAAAAAVGFTYKGDHYDRCAGDSNVPVMQLWPSNQLPNEMELTLDIPMTVPAANMLGDFFAVGNDLCCRLDAVMADPTGNPIGTPAAAMISRHMTGIYEEMSASGVHAGSQRARRIFSRI